MSFHPSTIFKLLIIFLDKPIFVAAWALEDKRWHAETRSVLARTPASTSALWIASTASDAFHHVKPIRRTFSASNSTELERFKYPGGDSQQKENHSFPAAEYIWNRCSETPTESHCSFFVIYRCYSNINSYRFFNLHMCNRRLTEWESSNLGSTA